MRTRTPRLMSRVLVLKGFCGSDVNSIIVLPFGSLCELAETVIIAGLTPNGEPLNGGRLSLWAVEVNMVAFVFQGTRMNRHLIRTLLILTLGVISCCTAAQAQRTVQLPELSTKRLMNDLQVSVAATPSLGDSMAIGLVLRYGASFDPLYADKGGLASLLSKMFMKATIDMTSKDIQDELAAVGATIEISCGWDGFRFLLRGQSSRLERSLLLLYRIVGEAQFNDSDFAAVKQSVIQSLQNPPDPRQEIHSQLENVLFNGTTYGRPIQGTPGSVSKITVGDVRLFYQKYFSPSEASLVIVGNVAPSLVLQRASRIWGVWVRNDDVPFTFVSPRPPSGRKILIEDDPGSPAAQFILGNLFPRRQDPAYVNAILAAGVLQERLTKALPTSLLTVGDDGRRIASLFFIQGQAAADQTVDQIVRIEKAAEEIRSSLVSNDELAAAQKRLIDEFNRELVTTDGICSIMLDSELYHLGSNYAAGYPEMIRRCDAAALKQAANDYIFPGGLVLLLRGPAATLKPTFEHLGAVEVLTP
jgi:zinc protease